MTADVERVKNRIRKLLNVAKNDAATEGEIDNALRFAKDMMDSHHLSEEDLVDEPEDQYKAAAAAKRDRVFVSAAGKFYTWEKWLSSFVAEFVGGVGVYLDRGKRIARDHRGVVILDDWGEPYRAVRYCFYGIAEDVHIAAELFHELRLTIKAMARLRWGSCYVKDGGVYCEGFVMGLCTKIERQKKRQRQIAQQSGSTALVLVDRRNDLVAFKKKKATDWLAKSVGIRLSKASADPYGGANGSSQAYCEGIEDGERADVSVNRKKKLTYEETGK